MKYCLSRMTRIKPFLVFVLIFLLNCSVFGQVQYPVPKKYDNLNWQSFVEKIKEKYGVRIFYHPDEIKDIRFNIPVDSLSLEKVLNENVKQIGLRAVVTEKGNVFLTKDPFKKSLPKGFFNALAVKTESITDTETQTKEQAEEFLETATEYIPETFVVGSYEKGALLKNVILKGYAKNAISGEAIIGATIMDKESSRGVATDENGYFEINLSKGKHILIIQSVNIKEKRIEVDLRSNGSIELLLDDKVVMLEDVIIRGQRNNKVKTTQMGIERLSIKSVKKIPLVFGEKDVVKVALLLPGVKSLGEGSAGFNVRGSPSDQNLFYINNVPIYNTSHAAGFFSAFNSDAIEEFALYKSNIPISYGGRLSSIFNIKAKSGNKNRFSANGGISPITGRLLVEGPIQDDKSSFLLSARSTYSNWILEVMDVDEDIKDSRANFYDAVTNFSFKINDKNELGIFTYASHDKMKLAGVSTMYKYSNIGGSIIWKHYFNNQKNFFDFSIAHSMYDFTEEVDEVDYLAYKYSNAIDHSELKMDININTIEHHKINYGVNSILYKVNRGLKEPLNQESTISVLELGDEKGIEAGVFISDEWEVSKKLTVYGGLRYNMYSSLGPQKVYKYADGLPKITENVEDSIFFKNNEIIKFNGGLDIRLAAKYMLDDDISLKFSYNRLRQNIFMLSNTIAVSPNFKWKLSDYNIKPSIGDQISAGFFANIFANRYELSIEGYYKKVQNLLEIKDGEDLFLNQNVETSTLQGELDAYGVEFMIKKLYGKLTGWFNYTYSRSSVLVDSELQENQINNGESYLSNYDKPHAINLVATYDFSRRVNISGNLVYSTGRPITYPTGYYYWDDSRIINYSKRNKYRIPDYFRVDLSITVEGSLRKRKFAHGSWTLSVYNLLGRKNAYSVFYKRVSDNIKAYKLSIFGVPMVSLTYNIKLGNYEN